MYQANGSLLLAGMRRTVPLLLAVLLLTGCAGQSLEDAYVAAVVDEVPQILDRGTKGELAELGANACEYIDGGMTPNDVVDRFVGLGISAEESSVAVDKAVEIICP